MTLTSSDLGFWRACNCLSHYCFPEFHFQND